MSVNKKGKQKTLTNIGFKVNKVTDADVSDKEQGNENEIGSEILFIVLGITGLKRDKIHLPSVNLSQVSKNNRS
jgi:hypothetical protein